MNFINLVIAQILKLKRLVKVYYRSLNHNLNSSRHIACLCNQRIHSIGERGASRPGGR